MKKILLFFIINAISINCLLSFDIFSISKNKQENKSNQGKNSEETILNYKPVTLNKKGHRSIKSATSKIEKNVLARLNNITSDTKWLKSTQEIVLLAFKDEKILEVWKKKDSNYKFIKKYEFTNTSGDLGPKLKEGDYQIPEGIYKINFMNANSSYHLSMQINYPNSFDKKMAKIENRSKLGGEIFIHGSHYTVGCIPLGDIAIEEIFYLVHKSNNTASVIISPIDFRKFTLKEFNNLDFSSIKISWIQNLYQEIYFNLKPFYHEINKDDTEK